MTGKSGGEMPFLDHLEELRYRLLRSIVAVAACVLFGIWAAHYYSIVDVLQAPIKPYMKDGLAYFGLFDPMMAELRIGFLIGMILASPIIAYQIWGFLSPALYTREKRAVLPTLFIGLVLFLIGAWVAWIWLWPGAIAFAFSYSPGMLHPMLDWDGYWSGLVLVVFSLGLSMELPLVMTLLAWIRVMDARKYASFRRVAIVINTVVGAIIAPGVDPVSALMVAVPLCLLYEAGIVGAKVVERARRLRAGAAAAAVLALLLLGGGSRLSAQVPVTRPPTTADSGRASPPKPVPQDTMRSKRLGLPVAPQRIFLPDDSTLKALLLTGGFRVTRFMGDSGDLVAADSNMVLTGKVAVQRDSGTVEAEQLIYRQADCAMVTKGETQIFEPPRQPSVGRDMRLDICKDKERMVLNDALTVSTELGGDWYLRGNLAVDSSAKRLYMGGGEFTTCALPIADYHFASSEVKWVGQSALVARPAVLYVRDVPVMWLPFLFQDTKPGRRSGILIPQFGINDIVRPTRTYNRQVTNLGYYYAPSDYVDLTGRVDWYASRHLDLSIEGRYKVSNRFLNGGFGYLRQQQVDGGSSSTIHFDHSQQFDINTTLLASLNYTTNTAVAQGNIIDPYQSVQQILSSLSFTRRTSWGQITIGGRRNQSLTDGSGQMSFPTLSISPKQIALAHNVSWGPSLSFDNTTDFKRPLGQLLIFGSGIVDTLRATSDARATNLQFNTPFQFGRFNLRSSVTARDESVDGRVVQTHREPDPAHPGDSLTVTTIRAGDYRTTVDWTVGIDLPQLFSSTLKLTPSVGIVNTAPGPYFLRSAATNGAWVHQSKRLQTALSAAPAIYGFLNTSIGPLQRMRHEFLPSFQLQYSPSAPLSADYIRALAASGGGTLKEDAPATMQLNVSLSQNLWAKLHPPASDTTSDQSRWPKIQIFSLSTSGISYDFEQAKLAGRTGWVTPSITNSLQSGLLPGLQLSLTHDLWEGVVGTDTATFSPYLTALQANVSLSGRTFSSIFGLLGLRRGSDSSAHTGAPTVLPPTPLRPAGLPISNRLGQTTFPGAVSGGPGFSASLNLTINRPRPNAVPLPQIDPVTGLPVLQPNIPRPPASSAIGITSQFSPTAFWHVNWSTQYNVTAGRFEMQNLQLQRDLHDWRANFNFQKSPNGNFSLIFSIALIGFEQDIKFDYQQSTVRPLGVP